MKQILYVLFFISTVALAQNKKIDSLKQETKKVSSDKFDTYNSLAWKFARTFNKDSLLYYNNQSSKFIEDEKQKGMFHVLNSKYYLMMQDFDKAIEEANLSIKLATKENDFSTLGSAYNTFTNIEHFKGNIQNAYNYSKKNLEYTLMSKNKSKIFNSYVNLNALALSLANYNDAKKYYIQARRYFTNENLQEQVVMKVNLGMALLKLQDHKRSIQYLYESEKMFLKLKIRKPLSGIYSMLCENYTNLKNIKKAFYYGEKSLATALNKIDSTNSYFAISKYYLTIKEYDIAKKYILKSIEIDKSLENDLKLGEDYAILATINLESGKINEVDPLLIKSLKKNEISQDKNYTSILYRDLIINHFKNENNLEYLNYFEKYITDLNNSLGKEKVKSLAELDKKYRTAEKESQIKTQQLQIEKEKNNRNMALGGVGFLIFLSGGGYFWFRNRQKQKDFQSRYKLLELQNNISALKVSVLNKQLNPHFINNTLTSMSPKLQKEAPETYQSIVKLSRLIGSTFGNESLTDSLETQLEGVQGYLDLQKLILHDKLSSVIHNDVQNNSIEIPRLLLQNLVENSVEHGIKRKGEGNILLQLTEDADFINIIVEDNGYGRETTENRGIGTTTYQDFFHTFNKSNSQHASFEFEDKKDISGKAMGTIAKVQIPKNYQYTLTPNHF